MDDEVIDRFIDDIDPSKGFNEEVDRLFRQAQKHGAVDVGDSPRGASNRQKAAIRGRITGDERYKGDKINKGGRRYIRIDENNYKRVTRKKDIYEAKDGTVFLRDESGRFQEAHKFGDSDNND